MSDALKPGWLSNIFNENAIEVATWPKSLRRAGGFTDAGLTESQRIEAVRRLRERIDELEGHYERNSL